MNEQIRDKGHTHMFRGTQGTNQNFIARPRNADIDSTGCQDEQLPQTLNQLVTSAQLKYIDKGRNLGEHRKLRVSVSGSIRNLRGTAILCPEQLREPENFSHVASPAHLLSKAYHRTQWHANQESQAEAADPSQNFGSLEIGARLPNCHGED